jgi:FtsH-like protein
MTGDPRSICAECGHVRSWHDRDAARSAAPMDSGVDRPCYREVGGAPCRCKGFRDSGEVAVGAIAGPRPTRVFKNGVLTLLLVVLGLSLLYAYRSQTPAIQSVPLSQAIQEVNAGQIKKITIVANRATLELAANGEKQQTFLPDRDEVLVKAVTDYNTANPSRQIVLEYQQESATFSVVGSIVLSLLPVLLIGGFFYYMMRQSMRR